MFRLPFIVVVAALAALDVLIRINLFGWLGVFSGAAPLAALESGFWVLLLAAALFAMPALGLGRAGIMVGTVLIAVAELLRLGTLIWASRVLTDIGGEDLNSLTRVQESSALAAAFGAAVGAGLLAWGLWRESDWTTARPGAIRLGLILLAMVAAIAEAMSGITEAARATIRPADLLPVWLLTALSAITSVVWIAAAIVTLRAARSGPPIDWRWPVGIGITLFLVAAVALRIAIVIGGNAGMDLAGWFTGIRLVSASGLALLIAGLASAAFIGYPESA